MSTSSRCLPLRILYTINAAPQYILAKSFTPYPVQLISVDDGPSHIYASTALKHCLHTICRSSPELVQDNSRDFSVYVLDPLESNSAPAPVHISDSSAHADNAPGVAVGLGLMSWALRDEEPVTAVGTLVKAGGSESLEIVFALREVRNFVSNSLALPPLNFCALDPLSELYHVEYTNTECSSAIRKHDAPPELPQRSCIYRTWPSHHILPIVLTSLQSSSFASTSVTHSYPHNHAPYHPPPPPPSTQKPPRTSRAGTKAKPRTKKPVPATGSDKLLDSADVYIGPQKKQGRPRVSRAAAPPPQETPTNNKGKAREVIVLDDDSHSHWQQPIPRTSAVSHSYANSSASTSLQSSSAPTPAPSQIKTEAPSDAQMLAKLLSGSSSENAAILATLSSIDSISENDAKSNPVLVAALRQLVAAMQKQAQAPPQPPNPPQPQASQDDDVVLLDKENVNPAPFNKKRRDADTKLRAMNGSHPSQSAPISRTPSITLRPRSNENTPLQTAPLTRSHTDGATTNAPRKRTLSDFMDERDSNRSRDKSTRTKERTEKRDPSRSTFLQPKVPADAFRHYRQDDSDLPTSDNPLAHYRTPLESWTSPVRPKGDNNLDPYLADSETRGRDVVMHSSPVRPAKTAASSPIRGNNAETSNARKKYIVPAWARTNTATQPRLSEEAQQALKDAEERKRLERRENRRNSANVQERARRKKELATKASTSGLSQPCASANVKQAAAPAPPPPSHSSPIRPLVAAVNISPLAGLFASRRPRSPSPAGRFVLPQTPTRPRKSGTFTSGGMADSLFTPGSVSGSIFGSARGSLFTPDAGYGPSGSPLNRKKMKTTPQTPLRGTPRKRLFEVPSTSSSDIKDLEEVEDAVDVDLEKELDAAFEDLNSPPPSSLPVASSDTELDGGEPDMRAGDAASMLPPSGSQQSTVDTDDDGESHHRPRKEIWEGLPPSSPPPPSSPVLLAAEQPSDTDMDDLELPVATSDMETDFTDVEGTQSDGLGLTSEDEVDDFAAYFSLNMGQSNNGHEMPVMKSDDVFSQFTNIADQSDVSVFQPSSDETVTEFALDGWWQNFNPLLQSNMIAVPSGSGTNHDALLGDLQLDGGSGDPLAGIDFSSLQSGGVEFDKVAKEVSALYSGCLV